MSVTIQEAASEMYPEWQGGLLTLPAVPYKMHPEP